jgi:hypothetical protein
MTKILIKDEAIKEINKKEKRFTPIEEFERFAERLYNYNPHIQGKIDFDKTFDEMMEGRPKSQILRNKSWDIIKSKYLQGYVGNESKQPTRPKNEHIKPKLPKDYLARVWNPKLNHYQTKYVSKVVTKTGKIRYFNGSQFVKVEKVKKV